MNAEFRFMCGTHATRTPVYVADMPHEWGNDPNSHPSCCRYATRQGVFDLFVWHQTSTSIDIYHAVVFKSLLYKPFQSLNHREVRT